MRSVLAFATMPAVGLVAGAASAHHALDALYDTSSEVQTTATLAKVEWINPHAWMRFDVQYPNGKVEKNVLVETLGTGGLRQQGIERDALEVGAQYAITFYPTRNGRPGGFMTKMVRPNGSLIGTPADGLSDDCCTCPSPGADTCN